MLVYLVFVSKPGPKSVHLYLSFFQLDRHQAGIVSILWFFDILSLNGISLIYANNHNYFKDNQE